MSLSKGKNNGNEGSNPQQVNFLQENRLLIMAGFIFISAFSFYLFNPFQETALKTEYHSGRDSFTIAPGQIPKPPVQADDNGEHSASSVPTSTPQTAAIQAQLAAAETLPANSAEGREARQQRIADINQLIAKVDKAEGNNSRITSAQSDSGDLQSLALDDPRTRQISQDLDALKARTERLEKRLN